MLCEDSDSGPYGGDDDAGIMAVMLHDTGLNKWQRFTHTTPVDEYIDTMRAGDGGLVCMVSLGRDKKEYPLRIIVFNPLTRQWRELSELVIPTVSLDQPSMVQLVMDRETKYYKVIAVVPKGGQAGDVVASIRSSETGQWIRAKAFTDLIFGYRHKSTLDDDEDDFYFVDSQGPCAYDCTSGKLIDLDDAWKELGESRCAAVSYALVRDRLFVLDLETVYMYAPGPGHGYRYCISEYQAKKRQPHRKKVRVHKCTEFDVPARELGYRMHLSACNSFLLVTANNSENGSFRHEIALRLIYW